MRIAVSINLSEEEHNKFTKLLHSGKTPVRLLERVKIILLAHAGKDNKSIADELGIGKNKVGLWRKRYAEGGLKALEKNLPRGKNHAGKSSLDQLRLRHKVIKMTTQEKPADATHWSTRSLAKALNTTDTFVHRVWKSVGLKPHLVKHFKVSNDPLFEEKLHDVVGLYLDPPENAVVFCVDEKSSIQALDRTQPGLPLKQGRAETMTHDYKRHGTSTLFAALEVQTGRVIGQCKKQHRHQEFLSFLKEVEKKHRRISLYISSWTTMPPINIRK